MDPGPGQATSSFAPETRGGETSRQTLPAAPSPLLPGGAQAAGSRAALHSQEGPWPRKLPRGRDQGPERVHTSPSEGGPSPA